MNKKTEETIEILTQEEADKLLKYPKKAISANDYNFPTTKTSKLKIPLKSTDELYSFYLDINRNKFNLYKITYQNRYIKETILARLDLNGAPHQNPDHSEVSGNHLHLYKEGYSDKFAIELPEEFNNIDTKDIEKILVAFLKYCNIINPPTFRYSLHTDRLI